MAAKKKHPGFENVAEEMAKKQGISKKRASAELASRTRKASPKAKAKNPRLNHVKGSSKKSSKKKD